MGANDGYLRSDVDKGETSPDNDLRLRTQASKEVAAVIAEVMSVTWANLSEVLSTLKANIDEVMTIGT